MLTMIMRTIRFAGDGLIKLKMVLDKKSPDDGHIYKVEDSPVNPDGEDKYLYKVSQESIQYLRHCTQSHNV